ncbi:MAG TPA: hypothetical protein VF043_27600, partial [Ktedonobacteraceae bacterium]
MNCIQAQAMLAEYRELRSAPIGPTDTGNHEAGRKEYDEADILELDAHLKQCASCRQVLARYNFIGEQLRSLAIIEPPPEMHANLMHALAKEQLHFIQRSTSGTVSTPEFLKPYLQEHAQPRQFPDAISAFSTAETGPLPVIHAKRKRHPRSHINQFAVLGIAAMFLMLLMMGGITSLLLLAHGNAQVVSTVNKTEQVILPQSDLTPLKYTTTTLYSHVVSAIADNNDIYYTAYSDGADSGWMLAKLDRTTRQSTNLLMKASTNPLVVLGAANGLLVWLQFDDLKSTVRQNQTHTGIYSGLHAWSLHYLAITSPDATANTKPATAATLLNGVFNRNTAPSWISTPVQGVWFVQNSLLVAMIDTNGTSHLLRYDLGTGSSPSTSMIEIATAPAGEILTSPTANTDGSDIFWAEEWLSADGNLHSNIWVQRVLAVQRQLRGKMLENTARVKEVYRSDGLSFRPQVVDNTLFLLSTSNGTISTTSVPVPVRTFNIASVPRIDTSAYAEPMDNFVQGTVLMIPLDGDSVGIPTTLGTVGQSSALQAGNNFAMWQDNDSYKMYDVQTASDVTVGQVLNGANFVAVNSDTTVWTAETGTTT